MADHDKKLIQDAFLDSPVQDIMNLGVIQQIESGGERNPVRALNKGSGARGLHQVTKIALDDYNQENPNQQYTSEDLYNPQINSFVADWTINTRIPQLFKWNGVPDTNRNRLSAYNWGPTRTRDYLRWKKEIPGKPSGNFLKYMKKKGLSTYPEETKKYWGKYVSQITGGI